jgi:hypothetical protein
MQPTGKDAFHRVPNFASKEWDAVERVPTRQFSARAVWLVRSGLPLTGPRAPFHNNTQQ